MHIPTRALPHLHRLLTWSQRAGVVMSATEAGTLGVIGDHPLPADVVRAMADVGPVALQALESLAIPAPGIAQAVLWWEVAAQQLSPDARRLLPLATQARRQRLVGLRSVHLAALADVALATAFPPSA